MNPERRLYPRLNVNIPAEVEVSSGEGADVNLINISLGGMLIEGDERLQALRPPVEGAPLELGLHFGLEEQPVHCRCRVVYQQRQSQCITRFGLCVLSIDQQAADLLQNYISARLG